MQPDCYRYSINRKVQFPLNHDGERARITLVPRDSAPLQEFSIFVALLVAVLNLYVAPTSAQVLSKSEVKYKIGIIGSPDNPKVLWNDSNMLRMKSLGFNAIQVNIAWGSRPEDEPLNLEDVVTVPKKFQLSIDRELANALHSPARIAQRSMKLRHRIAMCQKYGFHMIFGFGAPFQGHPRHETEPLPQCISDTLTVQRYVTLIKEFGKKFPGVDDLLMYTYDQDAWLCSEYGSCSLCHGVPVAIRVARFVNTLAHTWRMINPKGILWWEPWELSAGQVYSAVNLLDTSCVGLAIHSNIAEVQIVLPADRWFKNVLYMANRRRIPVIAEVWLGSPTEEMEPYTHIPTPLLTLQELRAVCAAGNLAGVKEYYGNVPDEEDPNLRMTGIFFHDPSISDSLAFAELSSPYGPVAKEVERYWKLASEAVAFYPWDVSWHAREVGRSDPIHLMTAATLKGACWATPAWQSSRKTYFMRTDETDEPNFWMREDMQLRFAECASLMGDAIDVADSISSFIPAEFKIEFKQSIDELKGFHRRVLAYEYHLRETNLAQDIRTSIKMNLPVKERLEDIGELRGTLIKDQLNEGTKKPIGPALQLLDKNLRKFLQTYFLPSAPSGQRNDWTITSN